MHPDTRSFCSTESSTVAGWEMQVFPKIYPLTMYETTPKSLRCCGCGGPTKKTLVFSVGMLRVVVVDGKPAGVSTISTGPCVLSVNRMGYIIPASIRVNMSATSLCTLYQHSWWSLFFLC